MMIREDLTNRQFGSLKVIEFSHKDSHRNSYWKCQCECGNITIVAAAKLKSGHTKSCGCLKQERVKRGYKVDLTNKRFGMLEVKGFAYYKNGSYWHCKCDCGREKDILGSRLTNNRTKSCGCLNKKVNHSRAKDLTDQRFGNLVARTYNMETGKWHCECDCGNEKDIATGSLISGRTKSCGCLHKKVMHETKFKDLTGKKFNMLKVIELNRIDTRTYWNCLCDCGKEIVVEGSKLGRNQSCGCIDVSHAGSADENEIKSFIQKWFPNFVLECHNREALQGKEIDIYIPEIKVGIEYNGSAYHATENGLHKNLDKYYHRDKFLAAREKGIHLITIFDIDYINKKWEILNRIKYILSGNKKMFIPDSNIIYTDNDYDIGIWLKDCGYKEVGQEEPESFIFDKNYLVYRCGRTKWIFKEELQHE